MGDESSAHVEEAIRQLELAVESGECGVCRDLYVEEIETLRGIQDLKARASAIAAVQAEKREQLGDDGASGLASAPLSREYVEVREHVGPDGPHREIVRGAETEPRRLFNLGGGGGLLSGLMRDRPRLTDYLPGGRK